MPYSANLLRMARHLLLVLALPALAGCQKTLVFFEQTAFKLGISVNEEPPIPLEVTVGLKRRVVAISPPKKPLEQGSPSSEAVSSLSRFDVIYLPDGETTTTPSPAAPSATSTVTAPTGTPAPSPAAPREATPEAIPTVTAPTGTPSPGNPFRGTLRITSAFASGEAAVTLAGNTVAMAAVVDPQRVETIVSSTAAEVALRGFEPRKPPTAAEIAEALKGAIGSIEETVQDEQLMRIQSALCVKPDGIFGDDTRWALAEYRAGMTARVLPDEELLAPMTAPERASLQSLRSCQSSGFLSPFERAKLREDISQRGTISPATVERRATDRLQAWVERLMGTDAPTLTSSIPTPDVRRAIENKRGQLDIDEGTQDSITAELWRRVSAGQ